MQSTLSKKHIFVILLLVTVITIPTFFYIKYFTGDTPNIHLIHMGMTQAQVKSILGEPDWIESPTLWAYAIRSDGITGWIFPYYISFDKTLRVDSIFS